MKGSVDLDVQPHISPDHDESQGELSPPDETLDCDSLNHTSTDYITWNGTRSFSDKHPLKVQFLNEVLSFLWDLLQGQGQMRTLTNKRSLKSPDVTSLLVNSLRCMRSIATATEAVEQWQQLQLRAFTVILVCIKGSIYLLLTMMTKQQPLSSFTDHR